MKVIFIDFIVTYKDNTQAYSRMSWDGFQKFLNDNLGKIKNIYFN